MKSKKYYMNLKIIFRLIPEKNMIISSKIDLRILKMLIVEQLKLSPYKNNNNNSINKFHTN